MESLYGLLGLVILWYLAKDSYPSSSTTTPREPPIVTPPRIWSNKPIPEWKPATEREVINYESYIKSIEWIENPARRATLLTDNYCCRMCSRRYALQVHHITYENLGNEKPEDLVTLCLMCHNHTHRMAGKGAKTYPPIKSPIAS